MRHFPLRTLIVLLWLVLMGWFLRYDAFPGWFTGTLDGYRGLLSGGEVFSDEWMLIKFQEHPIGYSHLQVEMDEKHPSERYRVTSRTFLQLNLGGEQQLVNVQSISRLDAFQRLVSFEFSLNARRYVVQIRGHREQGELFRVVVHSDAGNALSRVRIPDDVVLYSPMTMMAMGRMKPGETIRLKTLDPASMDVAAVLVKALRREPHVHGTNRVEATVLSVAYQGMEMMTWVDAQGQVLRQDTPFGWSMVASTSEEALNVDLKASSKADLMRDMAVRVQGAIADVETCRFLTVRLQGMHFSLTNMASARQQVAMESNATAVVTLRAGVAEPATTLSADERASALASTAYIQSAAPALRKQAADIVAGLTNEADKALAIAHWVNKSVQKKLTVSMPSALDVLAQREGDCNEHTYLCVGLARAAGLPAQVRVGLLYKDGAYFYHAWPAIHVGHWLELDPTLGWDTLGVRHLALLEGELGSQLKLMSVLGQLRVDVLEQRE